VRMSDTATKKPSKKVTKGITKVKKVKDKKDKKDKRKDKRKDKKKTIAEKEKKVSKRTNPTQKTLEKKAKIRAAAKKRTEGIKKYLANKKDAKEKGAVFKAKQTLKPKLPHEQKVAKLLKKKQKEVKLGEHKLMRLYAHRPYVHMPESIKLLNEKKRAEVVAKMRAKQDLILAARWRKHVALRRGLHYEALYHKYERKLIENRRKAKRNGRTFYVDPEPNVLFVIRIRGILGVSPKVRKALQLLRLRQIHNGVFVKVNGCSLQLLKLVEPYVTWGAPNLKSVRELIYKRGFGKIGRNRVRLADNSLVEDSLKKYGCMCMEDVIFQIYTCGKFFKQINNFLWPFKLSSPLGGFKKKRVHFVEGGDAGDREHYINRLIRMMN